jgi:hypothetical protein
VRGGWWAGYSRRDAAVAPSGPAGTSEAASEPERAPKVLGTPTGDFPVRSRDEDRLNRGSFADVLAEQLASAPGTGGLVFGLAGPWGSGKTSILNMIEEALKERHPKSLFCKVQAALASRLSMSRIIATSMSVSLVWAFRS